MDSMAHTALRRTYPHHRWFPVESAAPGTVYALRGTPDLFVKIAPLSDSLEPGVSPLTEAQRTRWLTAQGVATPEVLDAGLLGEEEYLVTRAAAGRPVTGPWPKTHLLDVIDAVADTAIRLHRIPVGECPFDRRLKVTVPMAQEAAGLGEVDLTDLDESRKDWSVTQLVTDLLARARLVGREEPAVCHGDFTPSNVLIDPATLCVTAIVDTARCGVADRYTDLALMTRDLTAHFGRTATDRFIYHYGEFPLDAERLEFYRLLDEFW